jgi:hypothetical protein
VPCALRRGRAVLRGARRRRGRRRAEERRAVRAELPERVQLALADLTAQNLKFTGLTQNLGQL